MHKRQLNSLPFRAARRIARVAAYRLVELLDCLIELPLPTINHSFVERSHQRRWVDRAWRVLVVSGSHRSPDIHSKDGAHLRNELLEDQAGGAMRSLWLHPPWIAA